MQGYRRQCQRSGRRCCPSTLTGQLRPVFESIAHEYVAATPFPPFMGIWFEMRKILVLLRFSFLNGDNLHKNKLYARM